ncbi:MAG: NAD(P)H-dependent oxidoreductase [Solirubrobacterales bacterium]|nr:NAD(P)H-dependent oxidoreductase [Solirubrobacterales bacterium]
MAKRIKVGAPEMTRLLHVAASPRGATSESLKIARAFLDSYRETHPGNAIETWDLWDGSVPAFGPAAATAKMAVFAGDALQADETAAWQAAQTTFMRFDSADHLLFSVPMWNAGIPYILKQLIDVISQPGMVFGVDPYNGYTHLLEGRGKKAAVIYTSAVWGPGLGASFGTNFQSTYFEDWLRWTGITDISQIRYHPTLTGITDDERRKAHAIARERARDF